MLMLYYAPGACSMASHIVLEESGEKYEPKKVDLAGGEQRTDAYLKINPQGRVPVLRLDHGEPLAENTPIKKQTRGPGAGGGAWTRASRWRRTPRSCRTWANASICGRRMRWPRRKHCRRSASSLRAGTPRTPMAAGPRATPPTPPRSRASRKRA